MSLVTLTIRIHENLALRLVESAETNWVRAIIRQSNVDLCVAVFRRAFAFSLADLACLLVLEYPPHL